MNLYRSILDSVIMDKGIYEDEKVLEKFIEELKKENKSDKWLIIGAFCFVVINAIYAVVTDLKVNPVWVTTTALLVTAFYTLLTKTNEWRIDRNAGIRDLELAIDILKERKKQQEAIEKHKDDTIIKYMMED